MPETARTFLEIGEHLCIADLVAKGTAIPASDQYDRQAIAQAISQLGAAQAAFTRSAIAAGGLEAWRAAAGERLANLQSTLEDVAGGEGMLTVSRLVVAAGQLSELAARAAP